MLQVSMHEAKARLSQLVEKALRGERVAITRSGQPAIELVPLGLSQRERRPGRLAGQIFIAPDFDGMPEEIIADFEGEQ